MKRQSGILMHITSLPSPYGIGTLHGYEEQKLQLACCHECQYFDWMYWPDNTELISWPREKQIARLRELYLE